MSFFFGKEAAVIVDAHTHLFGRDPAGSLARLLGEMDRAGIDNAVVFASPAPRVTNAQAIELTAPHRDRLVVVGTVSPLAPEPEALDQLRGWLADGRIRGIKFYTGYEYFRAADTDLLRPYLEAAQAHQAPVIFHTGDTYDRIRRARLRFAQPLDVDDLAVEFPELPIVIAHLGYPWMTDAAAVLYKNRNVYADVSGLVYRRVTEQAQRDLVRRLLDVRDYLETLDKLIFGTDFPIVTDLVSYRRFVESLPIPTRERDLIMGGNAQRLFKL